MAFSYTICSLFCPQASQPPGVPGPSFRGPTWAPLLGQATQVPHLLPQARSDSITLRIFPSILITSSCTFFFPPGSTASTLAVIEMLQIRSHSVLEWTQSSPNAGGSCAAFMQPPKACSPELTIAWKINQVKKPSVIKRILLN